MLRVVGRRADGYHLLQTVFQFIDRCDRLYFEPRADGEVMRRRGAPGVLPEQDLVVRAARALQGRTGCADGVTIDVHKVLPMGGGLGGGSSNAATTLLALNRLWDLGLDIDTLAEHWSDIGCGRAGVCAWARRLGRGRRRAAERRRIAGALVCCVNAAGLCRDGDGVF